MNEKNINLSSYIGEWIAIADNKVVAHGKNVKDVYATVQKKKIKKASFTAVPKRSVNLF